MKNKKLVLITIPILIMIVGTIIFTFNVSKKANKTFQKAGYILTNKKTSSSYNQNQTVKYYFNSGETYKQKYPEKITFSDIEGEKVVTDKENFVHYNDGSISALKNGVVIDLNALNDDPIKYYNIFSDSVLNKNNDLYQITGLSKNLIFKDLIWKLSDTKYLIASSKIKLNLGDEEVETDDYVEINFVDKGVVKIINQKATYQTISNDAYIEINSGVRLNLTSKYLTSNDKEIVSLDQMVIDSEDNIDVQPLTKQEEKEKSTEQNDKGNTDNSNANNNKIDQSNISENNETNTENQNQDSYPKFTIQTFETSSIKLEANVNIEDNDGLISSSVLTKIIDKGTNKTVYQQEDAQGVFDIKILTENLKSDTEYILVMSATYTKDNIKYTKDFISKVFRTDTIGYNISKNYYTDKELSFIIKADSFAKAKSANVLLLDKDNNIIKTVNITTEEAKKESGAIITFNELEVNTSYKIKMVDFLYEGALLNEGFEIGMNCKTLKIKPEIGSPEVTINKKDSSFTLKINSIKDTNHGIENYKFEIYDSRTLSEGGNPIETIEKSSFGNIDIKVDESKYFRGTPYVFKLVAEFNDNEKIIEYSSALSEVFKMDGVEFPTLRFDEEEITFEHIKGTIEINDPKNTISLASTNKILVSYTDSVGITKSFSTTGSKNIPFDVMNLRANETYIVSVYADVNLQDNNEIIDNCFIGSIILKTKKPTPFLLQNKNKAENLLNPFTVNLQLGKRENTDNTLEANTLTHMTITLYPGQSTNTAPIKTIYAVDSNLNPYESSLKEKYYDNVYQLTPKDFGLQNNNMTEQYYTIEISDAYDYTDYHNNIPVENTITVKTNSFLPDLPDNANDAIDVQTIRNMDIESKYRSDLNSETIIGYKVKALFDNSLKNAKKIIYKVYDENTGTIVDTKEVLIDETGTINYTEFYLKDGTEYGTRDNTMTRGNKYYFTYEAYFDLNHDDVAETKYPYINENGEQITLRSVSLVAPKQKATIMLYPSDSTATTFKWKYKYTDVDKTIYEKNLFAKIDGELISTKAIGNSSSNYNSITFTDLIEGNLEINIKESLNKYQPISEMTLVNEYFDGEKVLSNINYSTSITMNRLIITLLDYEENIEQMERIAALKVTLSDGNTSIVKDFQTLDYDSVAIDLYYFKDLLGKDLTIDVQAYYDSGITGFENTATKFMLQKTGPDDSKKYLIYNNSNNFNEDTMGNGAIYEKLSGDLPGLNLKQLTTNKTISLDSTYGEGGIKYKNNYISLKKISTKTLTNISNEAIRFDVVIPGVSLKKNSDELNITKTLDSAQVKLLLYGSNSSTIEDNKIYLELYETNADMTKSLFIKKIAISITNNTTEKIIDITNLNPKTKYYFKIYANLNNEGTIEKNYLYDIDFQTTNKLYTFSTLSDVGINGISYQYVADDYQNKNIKIDYNLNYTMGGYKIKYLLYKYVVREDDTKEKQLMSTTISDDTPKSVMSKLISVSPGSEFEFGKEYSIKIQPSINISVLGQTELQEVELGTVDYDFKLETLNNPFVGITSSSNQYKGLDFKVSILDTDKIIVGGTYQLQILDSRGNDITPTDYKEVDFNINVINNVFSINNLNLGTEYKMIIYLNVDKNNDGTNITNLSTTYKATTLDESNVDIGSVSSTVNKTTRSKIDLIFKNSFNLGQIEEIRYSIFNITSGYTQNNKVTFTPVQSGEYFTFTLKDEILPNPGLYYLELQFLINDKIVKTATIEHDYTN